MSKKTTRYTWASYKKQLFEGQDIKIIQKKVIRLASLQGLFIHKGEASRMALKLNRLELNKRRDIVAAMYMHITHEIIPADVSHYKNLKAKWGLSASREVTIFYVGKHNEIRDTQKLKSLGFAKLQQKLKAQHYIERFKTSVKAMHRLDVKDLMTYIDKTNILSISEALIELAKKVAEETQEEAIRYISEDVDNDETLIYPYKLLNRLNDILREMQELKKHVTDRILTKLERAEMQYEDIKRDIEKIITEMPKNSIGFLAVAESTYERLRSKWERLAELNLNYMEHIAQDLFTELNRNIKNE